MEKLRQKTKKRLLSLQTQEVDYNTEDDENLKKSVEELINPVENPLDPNDNYGKDPTTNHFRVKNLYYIFGSH